MKIKQTMRNLVLGGLLLFPAVFFATQAGPAYADCGGVETAIVNCEQTGSDSDPHNTGLWGLLIIAINTLTVGVGILAVIGFLYGGYLYITSGGSPDQVKKARMVFTNVVIGVVAFGGMFALLNFLVPGGVFN